MAPPKASVWSAGQLISLAKPMQMYLAFISIVPLTLINALPVGPDHPTIGGVFEILGRSDHMGDGASDHTENERKWPEMEWNAECEVKANSIGVDIKITGRSKESYGYYKEDTEDKKLFHDLPDLKLAMGEKCPGKVDYCRIFPLSGEKEDLKDLWHLDCSIESIEKDQAIQCANEVFNDWTPPGIEMGRWVHITCEDHQPQDSAAFAKGLAKLPISVALPIPDGPFEDKCVVFSNGAELRAKVFGYDADGDHQKAAESESLTISKHQITKPKPWFEPYLETKGGIKQTRGTVPELENMFNTCGGVKSVCIIDTEIKQRPSVWHLSCQSRAGEEILQQISSAKQNHGIQKAKELALQRLQTVLDCMGGELERWQVFPKKFGCQTLELRKKEDELRAWVAVNRKLFGLSTKYKGGRPN